MSTLVGVVRHFDVISSKVKTVLPLRYHPLLTRDTRQHFVVTDSKDPDLRKLWIELSNCGVRV